MTAEKFFTAQYFHFKRINNCNGCNHRRSNQEIKRKKLSMDNFVDEIKTIMSLGYSTLGKQSDYPIGRGLKSESQCPGGNFSNSRRRLALGHFRDGFVYPLNRGVKNYPGAKH